MITINFSIIFNFKVERFEINNPRDKVGKDDDGDSPCLLESNILDSNYSWSRKEN